VGQGPAPVWPRVACQAESTMMMPLVLLLLLRSPVVMFFRRRRVPGGVRSGVTSQHRSTQLEEPRVGQGPAPVWAQGQRQQERHGQPAA
jgi:hypothetical protein